MRPGFGTAALARQLPHPGIAQQQGAGHCQGQGEKAGYDRKAAGTNYLPKISAIGGYIRSGDEISLLSNGQKASLTNMGTGIAGNLGQLAGQIVQQHPDLAPLIGQVSQLLPQVPQRSTA